MLKSFCVPVTRGQWHDWLMRNLKEFRTCMSTVRDLRRAGSKRLRPRLGLPPAVARIQPQACHCKCSTNWALLLHHRTGWFAFDTRDNGVVVVFLMHLSRRTHYIQFPNVATGSGIKCMLDADFNIAESVLSLIHI